MKIKLGLGAMIVTAGLCVTLLNVKAESCPVAGCTQTEEHEHNVCPVAGCAQTEEHEHNVCPVTGCMQTEEHVHEYQDLGYDTDTDVTKDNDGGHHGTHHTGGRHH